MPWRQNISDAEFVRRVDTFQTRWRRPLGISVVVVSAIIVAIGGYFLRLIQTGVYPFFPDEDAQTAFEIGTIIGYVGGKCVWAALFGFIFGFVMLFARRKDQLLVSYHRRLLDLGELDNTQANGDR
jgi:hypothetical protein